MLTVRYETLGVTIGDRLLDLGAGGGRHAYEAVRLGACVTALDADAGEMKDVGALIAALTEEHEHEPGWGTAVVGDGLALPFPDEAFDRVIAAEVLEHIPEDLVAIEELARVLRPGGTMAVTVPRWYPELVNWVLSDQYHLTEGGHVRLYRKAQLLSKLRGAGLEPFASHHAHALHSPYWWIKCAVGVHDADHAVVRAYHRLLVWDISAGSPITRLPEKALNPILGKSLVVYVRKAA